MTGVLELTTHLPEIELGGGEAVVKEGGSSGAIWVLVNGSLEIKRGEVVVNTVITPGAMIGEISVLLGVGHGATVTTIEPSRFRYASDGAALIQNPSIVRLIAEGLARRLNAVDTSLADLMFQYGDAPDFRWRQR